MSKISLNESKDNLTTATWEIDLNDENGRCDEKINLTRFNEFDRFNFNVSLSYESLNNSKAVQPTQAAFVVGGYNQSSLKKFQIEVHLKLDDCCISNEATCKTRSENCESLMDFYIQPSAVWVDTHGYDKYFLKRLPRSNEWKSEKFKINLTIGQKTPSFTFDICIKFNTFGHGEIKAFQHMADYLYFQKANSDIKFSFGDGKHIAAHMNILSATSPVFGAMFSHKMKETRTGEVNIEDIQPEIFEELLRFIYLGRTSESLKTDTARALFEAADKYSITDLKKECESFLITNIPINKAMDLLIWANFHSAKDVKEAAMELVVSNIEQCCYTPEFAQLAKNNSDLLILVFQRVVETKLTACSSCPAK